MNTVIDNQQDLAEWVRAQRDRLDLAVAFWGDGAVELLGLTNGRKARILLDLSAGATNPSVVEKLQAMRGVQVKQRSRLHAKVYIGQSEVIIGSANASANGLGAEGHEATHWCELGLKTDSAEAMRDATTWFERHWSLGHAITPADLAAAKKAWLLRRRTRPTNSVESILKIARTNPEELKDRRIFLCVDTLELSDEEEKEGIALAEKQGVEPIFWYNWKNIPLSAVLICLRAKPDGSELEWENPKVCLSPETKPNHNVVLVRKGALPGYKLDSSLVEWRRRIQFHIEHYPEQWAPDKGGICVEITRFVKQTNAALM